MILGRPTNLWLGFAAAVIGFGSVTATSILHLDPETVVTVAGSLTALVGALIVLVANGPATVNEGDTVNVITPDDAPNRTLVA